MKKLQVEGWKVEKLGDVVEFQRGLTYSKKDEVAESSNVVLRANNVDLNTNTLDFAELKYIKESIEIPKEKIVTKGSLIICTASGSKSHLGKVALIDNNYGYAFGGFMGQITPRQNLDSKFLFYRMISDEYKDFISKLSDGANINNLRFNDLAQFEIPIPPLPEQQRIVSLLDETFAGLAQVHANVERNLVNAREVFEAVLEESVVGKDSRKWKVDTVGKVSEHSLGKMLDKQKNRGNFQKYLRNINVRWFDFDLSDVNEMRFLEEEKEKYTAIKGDLLICEGGYPGRAAIWKEDYPIYFQKAIHRVRFEKNIIPKWFLYCLYSADLSGRLKKYLTGTGIQHFTGQALDRFEFPIPPLEEQRAIVERLDALAAETSRLEAVYQSKLEAVEELKKSVLGKAFEGEL